MFAFNKSLMQFVSLSALVLLLGNGSTYAARGHVSEEADQSVPAAAPTPLSDSKLHEELDKAVDNFRAKIEDSSNNVTDEVKALLASLDAIRDRWVASRKREYLSQRYTVAKSYDLEAERERSGPDYRGGDRWRSLPASGFATQAAPTADGWELIPSESKVAITYNDNGGSATVDPNDPLRVNASTHSVNEGNRRIKFVFSTKWKRTDAWCQSKAITEVNSVIKAWK